MSEYNTIVQLVKALEACVKDMRKWELGHFESCQQAERLIRELRGEDEEDE